MPARVRNALDTHVETLSVFAEIRDPRVLASLAPSGVRGLLLHRGKQGVPTRIQATHAAHFDWSYPSDQPEMRMLYDRAKKGQWDGASLPWHTDVDPLNPEVPLIPERFFDFAILAEVRHPPRREGAPRVRREPHRVDAIAVPPRRAGRALRRGAGDRGRAVLRRQALRRDAGDGRGAPRGGVPPLRRGEARQALPDQRQPLRHHRRADERLALGHEVPRHADHGRGARARRVRHALQADEGAAAQGAAARRSSRTRRATCTTASSRCASTSRRSSRESERTRARGLGVRGRASDAQPLHGVRDLRRAVRGR